MFVKLLKYPFRVCILNFNLQASNEAIYSGGYRPNVRDVQYPTTHTLPRQDWQDREKAFPPKTIIEDRERRDVPRLQKFDIHRISDRSLLVGRPRLCTFLSYNFVFPYVISNVK